MSRLEVNIEYIEQQVIYGLWEKSKDRTIFKDINALSKQYYAVVSMSEGTVLPYFVLSRNYNKQNRDFELFIGSLINKSGIESCVLSAGEYAKITVKPKFGFLWGASVGAAKRYFYSKWLLENPYEALNMEYEYHTEKTIGKHPTIDIIFAIRKKAVNPELVKEYTISANIAETFELLFDKKNNVAYKALKELQKESEETNCVYHYIDRLSGMLDNDNSYIRTRGLILIAHNAKWDKDYKIDEIIDKYLQHITDVKPITARQCIKLLPIIAKHKPELRNDILSQLHKANVCIYDSNMQPLVYKDIQKALKDIQKL